MALTMRRAYPHAGVHFIPKGFVAPILETLQMKARKWTDRIPNVSHGGRPGRPKMWLKRLCPYLLSAGRSLSEETADICQQAREVVAGAPGSICSAHHCQLSFRLIRLPNWNSSAC